MSSAPPIHLLDYGAGNILSVRNAITAAGYPNIIDIATPEDITLLMTTPNAVIVFPGVGNFDGAMNALHAKSFVLPLKAYIEGGGSYFGICLGMQTLFHGSDECPGVPGLGIIPGTVDKFRPTTTDPVPHIGWNTVTSHRPNSQVLAPRHLEVGKEHRYFVHSYRAAVTAENRDIVCTTTDYAGSRYISSVESGNVFATQFHPEKSGAAGVDLIKRYLDKVTSGSKATGEDVNTLQFPVPAIVPTVLSKRVIAALDVRSNDQGDLVVTKGDQYDVREKSEGGAVRNLGKPAALAARYYTSGIDEIAFLNITSFRSAVLTDLPLLDLVSVTAKTVFVPLTVGGGIRDMKDAAGSIVATACEVADKYFRAGADKVSIGSDAVEAVLKMKERGGVMNGDSSIESIAKMYGVQAVVVSVDPKRVWVEGEEIEEAAKKGHTVVEEGGRKCWYQCTVAGGRESRDLDAIALARGVEKLGCGELMVNCIDNDGQGNGFNHVLLNAVVDAVSIPVIASSGAGGAEHFVDVFQQTQVSAALAAGIFHREEVAVGEVKEAMREKGIKVRG